MGGGGGDGLLIGCVRRGVEARGHQLCILVDDLIRATQVRRRGGEVYLREP